MTTARSWIIAWVVTLLCTTALLVGYLAVLIVCLDAPLRVSNSISYDAKLNFISRHKELLQEADTLIVGSSFALNNIDSAELENSGQFGKVINLGSWGLSTAEVVKLLEMLDLNQKSYLIYASQYTDIGVDNNKAVSQHAKSLVENGVGITVLVNSLFTLPQYLHTYLQWQTQYANPSRYTYLRFDEHGDVNYRKSALNLSLARWQTPANRQTLDAHDYQSLLELNQICQTLGAQLVVVRTPYRTEPLRAKPSQQKLFSTHNDQLQSLADNERFIYLDAHQHLKLDDQYFVDIAHLSNHGAEQVSRYISSHTKTVVTRAAQDKIK